MQKKRVFLTRTLHGFALKELRKKYQIEIHSGKNPISAQTREKILAPDSTPLPCGPPISHVKSTGLTTYHLRIA